MYDVQVHAKSVSQPKFKPKEKLFIEMLAAKNENNKFNATFSRASTQHHTIYQTKKNNWNKTADDK